MGKTEVPPEILKIIQSITNKRAKIVIDHILEHGFITTEELEKKYGYNHPPRAARDVRESGIPLLTTRVKSSDGRNIAAYKFGDLSKITKDRLAGRTIFSKDFSRELYDIGGKKCRICFGAFELRYLQVDHRVPYEVAGDTVEERDSADYMMLCVSCNRSKSWSCEHCENWTGQKSIDVCLTCYWASPENYSHVAMQPIRRADLVWQDDQVRVYEILKQVAKKLGVPLPEYIKKTLAKVSEKIK